MGTFPVRNEVAMKLCDDEQFKALRQQRSRLAEEHPFIIRLLEGEGAISITIASLISNRSAFCNYLLHILLIVGILLVGKYDFLTKCRRR